MPPYRCVLTTLHCSHPLPQPGWLHCLCPGPLAPDPPPQHPNGTCEHPSLGMSLFFLPPSLAPISLGVKVQVLHLPPTPPHPPCTHTPPSSSSQPHGLLATPQPHPPPRVTPTQGLSLPSSTSPLCPEFSMSCSSLLGCILAQTSALREAGPDLPQSLGCLPQHGFFRALTGACSGFMFLSPHAADGRSPGAGISDWHRVGA